MVTTDEYEGYLKVVAARKRKLAKVFRAIALLIFLILALALQIHGDWIYINALVTP